MYALRRLPTVGRAVLDAYVVGSGADSGADFRQHLNVRTLPAAGAALSLSRHRETPHHVLDARSGLRTVGRFVRETSAPVVATFHGATAANRTPTRLDERVTAAILVSESQRAAFRDHFPSERTFVIPYGVDTARFVPAGRPADEARIAVPATGCDDALLTRVTTATRAQHPEVVFTRVQGDEDARVAALQSATVALFPLAPVVASRALLEAMATGLPVVATNVGAVREYVDRAGILVAPDDPQAMAAAVDRILREPALAAELGRRARARALDFDLGTAAERHRAVYRWCRRNGNGEGTAHHTP